MPLSPLSQHVGEIPDRLEDIVAKCLAKEKDERYQTAKDLLIDLRNLRRKLDVDAEIERTVAPEFRSTSGASRSRTQSSSRTAEGTDANALRTASSAEYVVASIKEHKLAAGVVVTLLLIVAATGLGFYLKTSKSSVAGL